MDKNDETFLANYKNHFLLDFSRLFKSLKKELKSITLYDYNNLMHIAFHDLENKPLLSITKDKIVKYHKRLGNDRGTAYANRTRRYAEKLRHCK